MPAPRNVDWSKKTEAFFRDFINVVTYAAIADVTDDHVSDGESEKYDVATYQSYDNLQLPKEDRDTTAKNVFTVGTEINQFFRMILAKITDDIKESGCTATDRIESLKSRLSSDSYLYLVLDNASKYVGGPKLSSHVDSSMYLSSRLKAELGTEFLSKPVIVAEVAEEFYKFVKYFAFTFANWNWYTSDSMTENVVLGLFRVSLGFSNDKILELKEQKRPKVTKAKVTKKDSKDDETKPAETSTESTPQTSKDTPKDTPKDIPQVASVSSSVEDELGDI